VARCSACSLILFLFMFAYMCQRGGDELQQEQEYYTTSAFDCVLVSSEQYLHCILHLLSYSLGSSFLEQQ